MTDRRGPPLASAPRPVGVSVTLAVKLGPGGLAVKVGAGGHSQGRRRRVRNQSRRRRPQSSQHLIEWLEVR